MHDPAALTNRFRIAKANMRIGRDMRAGNMGRHLLATFDLPRDATFAAFPNNNSDRANGREIAKEA